MARVTRPGGAVAAAVWDYGGEMTLLRAFWDAAAALDPAARERDEARVARHCTREGLGALWTEAGLGDVAVGEATVAATYDGFADLWAPLEQGVGPAGQHTVALGEDERAALREDVRRRLSVGDEPFRLTARAWLARGRPA